MKRHYKVWIEIEELDAKGDHVADGGKLGILPDSLGSFASLKKATAKVAEVVNGHGVDPEHSDSVRAALPHSIRELIGDVLHATKAHLKVVDGIAISQGQVTMRVASALKDVAEGLDISACKLEVVLKDAAKPDPRESDDLQTVCLLAEAYMAAEKKTGFDGWDLDDVLDSRAALSRVKASKAVKGIRNKASRPATSVVATKDRGRANKDDKRRTR